jgi:hypothetical protein
MSEMQVLTRKRTRGYILTCLSLYPNEFVNNELIADFVRTCGISASNAEVEEQMTYLKEKEYIKIIEKGDPQISTKKTLMGEISAKGIDLLEGSITKDVGIMLPAP